jgi:hypothetical protein
LLPDPAYETNAQIRKYSAEDGFDLLNDHDQDLTLEYVEIQKQSALEEAGEPGT